MTAGENMATAGEIRVKLTLDTSEFDAALNDAGERMFEAWARRHPWRAQLVRVHARLRRTEPWRVW